MDNTQYTDAICESINIIAQSLVDGIQCDKTITCTIVDDSLKEQGQYLVTDGKTKFNAYSEDTSYRNNTVVYVTIPNGDFTEQKIITGKKVTSSNPFVYKSPFDDMFAISSNLASGISEQGLTANKRKTIGFFKTNDFWNCGTNGDNLIFTNNPQPSKIFNNSDMYDVLWSLPFCYNDNEHPGGYLVIPSIGIDWNKLKTTYKNNKLFNLIQPIKFDNVINNIYEYNHEKYDLTILNHGIKNNELMEKLSFSLVNCCF